jgi:putative tryptophan/tyrosine transport system substrate-binding protein
MVARTPIKHRNFAIMSTRLRLGRCLVRFRAKRTWIVAWLHPPQPGRIPAAQQSFSRAILSVGSTEGMKRRNFIALIGSASAWPLAGRAQQPGKVPTIGFLGANAPTAQMQWTAAFVQRLRELGWTEGRNVSIEYRWAEGRAERYTEIAAEFVWLKVDVVFTYSTPAVLAAKQATSVIPIVFATASDPVGTGLVANLARPGGNVTGLSNQTGDLAAKRVELLREVISRLARLAILANMANPAAVDEMRQAQATARALGLMVDVVEIRRAEDIGSAFEGLKGRADALYVVPDGLVNTNRIRINTLALAAALPTMHAFREYVESAGLMSYGPNVPDGFRRGADFVDKILRGAKPGDIPVEQPTKFNLVINLTTAKALGLDLPPTLLARADEVIE